MISIALPARQVHVTRPALPAHLVPLTPKAAWDGWFAIGIFDERSPFRWLKAHLFHRACRPGWHPVASFEGMDAHSEMLLAYATRDSVVVHQQEVDTSRLTGSIRPLSVVLADRFSLSGVAPSYRMKFMMPDDGMGADFHFRCEWPIWWSRWGRLLRYIGQHSRVAVQLVEDGEAGEELAGLGVMEHVAGFSLPRDITTMFSGGFHWDVLRLEDGGETLSSAAGLSLLMGNKRRVGIRAAVKLPGKRPRCMRGLLIRYLEVGTREVDGKTIGVPLRWEGAMKSREGMFCYEARSTTPVAGLVPGGGMMGFDFEGEWRGHGATVRSLSGVGFSEWGDFGGALIR